MFYFVCQVIEKKNSAFVGILLREKNTREDAEFNYHYLSIEDKSIFEYYQVIGILSKPEKSRKGEYKFIVNFHNLKLT